MGISRSTLEELLSRQQVVLSAEALDLTQSQAVVGLFTWIGDSGSLTVDSPSHTAGTLYVNGGVTLPSSARQDARIEFWIGPDGATVSGLRVLVASPDWHVAYAPASLDIDLGPFRSWGFPIAAMAFDADPALGDGARACAALAFGPPGGEPPAGLAGWPHTVYVRRCDTDLLLSGRFDGLTCTGDLQTALKQAGGLAVLSYHGKKPLDLELPAAVEELKVSALSVTGTEITTDTQGTVSHAWLALAMKPSPAWEPLPSLVVDEIGVRFRLAGTGGPAVVFDVGGTVVSKDVAWYGELALPSTDFLGVVTNAEKADVGQYLSGLAQKGTSLPATGTLEVSGNILDKRCNLHVQFSAGKDGLAIAPGVALTDAYATVTLTGAPAPAVTAAAGGSLTIGQCTLRVTAATSGSTWALAGTLEIPLPGASTDIPPALFVHGGATRDDKGLDLVASLSDTVLSKVTAKDVASAFGLPDFPIDLDLGLKSLGAAYHSADGGLALYLDCLGVSLALATLPADKGVTA